MQYITGWWFFFVVTNTNKKFIENIIFPDAWIFYKTEKKCGNTLSYMILVLKIPFNISIQNIYQIYRSLISITNIGHIPYIFLIVILTQVYLIRHACYKISWIDREANIRDYVSHNAEVIFKAKELACYQFVSLHGTG